MTTKTAPAAVNPVPKVKPIRSVGLWVLVWRELSRNWSAMFGMLLLVAFALIAIFATYVAPYDPYKADFASSLLPPNSPGHILGTDNLGRDYLSRLIFGSQVSLVVGFIVVIISSTVGVTLGALAGYYGGLIDNIIMRTVDILYAFPFLILAIAIVGIVGPSLVNMMIILGAISWIEYARVVRALVLTLKEREFIVATQALGASNFRIITRHILPNCFGILGVQATFGVASAILAAATLSFLGMGAQPPTPEWGAMLNDGQKYIRQMPTMAIAPGIAIMLLVIAINLVGDALRDALDPFVRGRQ
jgi:peptide/nickel transport system permease protein